MFQIQHKQIAHMVAQIRSKQKATKDSQDRVQKIIVEDREQRPDTSDAELVNLFERNLETCYDTSISINNYLKDQDLCNIGWPIKTNKTHLQLKMAQNWTQTHEEDLISQIENGKLYHKLTNTIAPDELPLLQSPSNQTYWGNENPSVSSVYLASIAAACGKRQDSMAGAAAFFPLPNSSYFLPDDLIPSSYPFASKKGMMLFGDYQYGAQRNFKQQLLFGAEDCSTAVGKATYLTTEQIQGISTASMIEAYFKPGNEYNYTAITFLSGDIQEEQLKLIQPGDIYLVKGHTAIIATNPDSKSNITTLQFNREIDTPANKTLGGGMYNYNLRDKAKETGVYILRPDLELLHESCSLSMLLNKIDFKYSILFPNGPKDIPGDCRIFFKDNSTDCYRISKRQ
ncbi:uncharacterized protein RP439-like [Uloborus diversus]|uniref:uncharacterized protein RP439-like n=1 Tax=Uloborus diversus TaxID=327109 RepID=UPI00240A88AA|nr:uncharacterized protein RP439-like [Uloborus diversus]